MQFRVLGSAAGGGFPQWNCGCVNCRGQREGTLDARPRTQESVALSSDGEHWFLLNASPEIRQQIEGFRGLWPREPRHSPIAGILLNNGDLDHCLGLLSLRESHPLVAIATDAVRAGFCDNNVLYRTLQRFPEQLRWQVLRTGEEQALTLPGGRDSGLAVTAIPVQGKRPLHLENITSPSPDDTVALRIRERATGRVLTYASAVGGPSASLEAAIDGADTVFFDGTFWAADELPSAGLGTKRAEDMAHWPVGGAGGSLGFLAKLPARRKVLIHINNTNPLLREGSPERQQLAAAGVELAYDGLEGTL